MESWRGNPAESLLNPLTPLIVTVLILMNEPLGFPALCRFVCAEQLTSVMSCIIETRAVGDGCIFGISFIVLDALVFTRHNVSDFFFLM